MLIECNECKNQISDRAIACPHCGAPVQTQTASVPVQEHQPEDTIFLGRTPNEWGEHLGSTGIYALIATFLFRATLFEDVYRFLFDRFMRNEGAGWLDRQFGQGLLDIEELKSGVMTGYVVPFIVFFIIILTLKDMFGSTRK